MHLVIDKNHLVNFSPSGNCNLSTHNTMIKKKNQNIHFCGIQFQSILFCSRFKFAYICHGNITAFPLKK